MKKLLAVVFFCLPAFGQATYSGLGLYSGSTTYVASGGSCAAPNFCAYNGVDLIPWGTVPNLGGETNNGATVFDTSFIGHLNRDGSTFSNSAFLSPVTRVTDTQSYGAATSTLPYSYTAGMNGAGFSPATTNADTTLVALIQASAGVHNILRFNTSGTNKGLPCSNALSGCTPWYYNGSTSFPTSGNGDIFITEAQKYGGNCTSNCAVVDFSTPEFDRNTPGLMYSQGMATDAGAPTTENSFYISPTTGEYWVGNTVADFKYGLPAYQASNWATSTNYSYGQYVIHPLATSEMATGGTWTTGQVYVVGDIVEGGSGGCMYKLATASGTSTSGSAPAFLTSGCKLETLTDAVGNKWQGTASTAQFLYQEMNPACTVSSPCQSASTAFQWLATAASIGTTSGTTTAGATTVTLTTSSFTAAMVGQTIAIPGAGVSGGTLYTKILSVSSPPSATATLPAPTVTTISSGATISLTGHPDMLSEASGLDANGLVWESIQPAYVCANNNQCWQSLGNTSIDTLNTITVPNAPGSPYAGASKFAAAFSANSYGMQPNGTNREPFANFNSGQGTGSDVVEYDAVLNVYHHLNTFTGIWTDYACSGGTGYNCSGGSWTWTTVGTLLAFSNPLATGQPCPWMLHGANMSKNGLYMVIEQGQVPYYACSTTVGVPDEIIWATTSSSFNQYASGQYVFADMNHYALGSNSVAAFANSGWGFNSGVFMGIYNLANVQGSTNGNPVLGSGGPPPFSVYLPAFASQGLNQVYPYPGCYVISGSTVKSPGCGINCGLDSHVSGASDPGTDTWPICGTTYNDATLNPVPFMQWQGFETCYSRTPTYPAGYTASSSFSSIAPGNGSPLCVPGSTCSQNYGNVWQFTHTFATGASVTFATQFQISELSMDGNWMFYSSDWDGCLGSTLTSNTVPAVWSSGTYYQQLLQVATSSTAAPICTPPNSLAGTPWVASSPYAAGNLINPIEGTGGTAQVDDVFQAQNSGTSGANSTLGFKSDPACLNYASTKVSCFANTNSPTSGTVTPTGASEVSATSTYTFSGASLQLNVGVKVTLAGWSPSGYNGTWTVTGTVGSGCPGTACGTVSTWQLTGLPTSLGSVAAFGTAAAQGDQVCDSPNDNGSGNVNGFNLSSCPGSGVVWQDLGPQTQRGDVFAVNLGLN